MPRTMSVSDSIVVLAEPSAVYERVSDPTAMGRWSPENRGARVLGEPRSTYVGMVFEGRNKRGSMRWTTRCTVTAADPGERFAFRVHAIGAKRPRLPGSIATWEYRFEAVDGGTRVTETWTDDRRAWPDFLANAFDRAATRGKTFAVFQRDNIRTTLQRLKAALESEVPQV
ncbi:MULTISPECIES: SRPBCC family protein [unclassified Streptomyces]|uniref:SRPBCC family protein n=1 Tax=unclassified Streptomyces TaxID=2593676 RepID=UPI00255495C5|nr:MULTISPECIES: SRPBCC family protein [unclassified Streptomyces]WRZ69437.1 SRPBCC family protein [Streptomyces sp. NBC_01257]WSU63371.1 SRPBCC family protein [Streptomyces sp. NBC_01104]